MTVPNFSQFIIFKKRTFIYVSLSIFFSVILYLFCSIYFVESNRDMKEILDENDVIGNWKLTKNSIDIFRQHNYNYNYNMSLLYKQKNGFEVRELIPRGKLAIDRFYKYSIVFLKDGSCKIDSINNVENGTFFWVSDGTWKLIHHKSKLNSIIIDYNFKGSNYSIGFNIYKRGDHLVLWKYFADPDSGEFIEYEKK